MWRAAGLALAGVVALVAGAFATGHISYVVTNGTSMEPLYRTGDLVVVARANEYHTGEIVAYRGGADGQLVVLHRIVGGNANGFDIKGDRNHSIDPTHPSARQIIGRAVLHIPRVGGVIGSPITRLVLLLAVLALIVALLGRPGHRRSAAHARRRVVDRRTTAWKLLLGLDVLLLAAAGFSFGHRSATTSTPAYSQTGILKYQTGLPASATYPTGHVVTGDPVFLKLVNTLAVSFSYSTDAPPAAVHGTVTVDAALSNALGWHSTLPMVAPTPLKAGRANVLANLDLSRIQSLAATVADQTGLGAMPIKVDVTASVHVAGATAKPVTYTTQLPFQLTTLELTMAGAQAIPSAHGPAVVSTSPLTPKTSTNHSPNAATRDRGLVLLALLLLAIAATALVWPVSAGRMTPADTDVAPERSADEQGKRTRLPSNHSGRLANPVDVDVALSP